MTDSFELQIGSEEMLLRHEASGWSLTLPIGTQQIERDHIQRSPPTESQVESAIAAIEEAIIEAGWTAGSAQRAVHLSGSEVKDILLALPAERQLPCTLTLDDVEALYRRFVNVVHGLPAAREGIPEDAAFSSRLLILREFMHHTGTQHIYVDS